MVSEKISDEMPIKITLGALSAVLFAIFGFAAWMTSMQDKANASAESIVKLELNQTMLHQTLISIDKRLARIEILLEHKNIKRGE